MTQLSLSMRFFHIMTSQSPSREILSISGLPFYFNSSTLTSQCGGMHLTVIFFETLKDIKRPAKERQNSDNTVNNQH